MVSCRRRLGAQRLDAQDNIHDRACGGLTPAGRHHLGDHHRPGRHYADRPAGIELRARRPLVRNRRRRHRPLARRLLALSDATAGSAARQRARRNGADRGLRRGRRALLLHCRKSRPAFAGQLVRCRRPRARARLDVIAQLDGCACQPASAVQHHLSQPAAADRHCCAGAGTRGAARLDAGLRARLHDLGNRHHRDRRAGSGAGRMGLLQTLARRLPRHRAGDTGIPFADLPRIARRFVPATDGDGLARHRDISQPARGARSHHHGGHVANPRAPLDRSGDQHIDAGLYPGRWRALLYRRTGGARHCCARDYRCPPHCSVCPSAAHAGRGRRQIGLVPGN